jgi:hypothetical protein
MLVYRTLGETVTMTDRQSMHSVMSEESVGRTTKTVRNRLFIPRDRVESSHCDLRILVSKADTVVREGIG